jgi:hypothetical protein
MFRGGDQSNGTTGNRQFLRSALYAVQNGQPSLADGNVLAMDHGYTNDYTAEDALKMGNSGENFGILCKDKNLSIEARKPFVESDTIFYTLNNLRRQTYEFRFGPENIQAPGLSAWLVDRFQNNSSSVSLSDSTFISFTVTSDAASAAADRFILVFKQLAPVPVSFTHIAANRLNAKRINVSWKVDNETEIARYELERSANGRDFEKINTQVALANNGSSSNYAYPDEDPLETDNFYRVRSIGIDARTQYSAIVKVGPLKGSAQISIYPNPVINKKINLRFNNMPSGLYTLQLSNKLGQVIYRQSTSVAGNNMAMTIEPGGQLVRGTYQLLITSELGEKKVLQVMVD